MLNNLILLILLWNTPAVDWNYGVFEGQQIVGELTHYCSCAKCCGKSDGITASGLLVKDGMVACNWLPLGSKVMVNEQSFIVTDRGGKSLSNVGRLDVYVSGGHQLALEKGRLREVQITILELP